MSEQANRLRARAGLGALSEDEITAPGYGPNDAPFEEGDPGIFIEDSPPVGGSNGAAAPAGSGPLAVLQQPILGVPLWLWGLGAWAYLRTK